MAATTFNRPWDVLLTTTLDNYRPTLVDNILKGIPLLYALTNGRGPGVRYEDGGHTLAIPVLYQKNPNVGTMSGYDRVTLGATDEGTTAFEPWANGYGTVGISREEMRQNTGRFARANLLRTKVDMLEGSLKELIESQLTVGTVGGTNSRCFIRGNSGKDFAPLGYLITKTTATGTKVHNIDPAVESWWVNKSKLSASQSAGPINFYGGAAGTSNTFYGEMANLYNQQKKGSTQDGPDYGLATQDYYELYENGMIVRQRFPGFADDQTSSLGFGGVMFKTMTLIWSEFVPSFGLTNADAVVATPSATAAMCFFLNTKYLEWVVDTETDFIITPFVEPVDQFAVWAKMLVRGQLTCTQRRKQGVHYAVNPAQVNSPTS